MQAPAPAPDAPPAVLATPAPAASRQPPTGHVKLRCHVEPDGAVSRCTVLEETPAGAGLGTAALRLSARFRMKPRTVDGRPVQDGTVTIPLTFKVGDPAPAPQNE